MPEEVFAIEDKKIIKVVSKGHIHDDDLSKTFKTVEYYLSIEKYKKILVDIREQISLPKTDHFLSFFLMNLMAYFVLFYILIKLLHWIQIKRSNGMFKALPG